MDVHTPKGPIHSLKDFGVEIVTIVLGVVIALSFEGLREWNHNRSLANEARDTIVREMRENQKAVQEDIASAPKRRRQVEEALHFANDVLTRGKTDLKSISLNFGWGDLRRSSWRTAEQTGALGHMTYAEVQRFASAYDLQDLYQAQQRRSLEHLSDTLVMVASGMDPDKASKPDVERFRERLLTLSADLYIESQIAEQLRDRYDKVLKESVQ